MKKLLLFVFILSTHCIYSQWFWQNPLPQGNTLLSVKFISSTIGWAVGDAGTILQTTNGGITWTSQSSGTVSRLEDIDFTDANNGWVVGWYGTILRTTNGGTTWFFQSSGTTSDLGDISFIDANNGWAVVGYGTLLRTTNGRWL